MLAASLTLILAAAIVQFGSGVAVADGYYGSYWVYGKIEQEYLARGGPSAVGNPTRPQSDAARGGKWQEFQNSASIYWHPLVAGGNAKLVGGAIRQKWSLTGWENGDLRYPTTSEFGLRDGGRGNHFEGGSIYWTSSNGANVVWGAIRDQWAAQGWENGPLGYPITDEYLYYQGYRQDFEGGSLTFGVGLAEPDLDPNSTSPIIGVDDPFNKYPALQGAVVPYRAEQCSATVNGLQTCVRIGGDPAEPSIDEVSTAIAPEVSTAVAPEEGTAVAPEVSTAVAPEEGTVNEPVDIAGDPSDGLWRDPTCASRAVDKWAGSRYYSCYKTKVLVRILNNGRTVSWVKGSLAMDVYTGISTTATFRAQFDRLSVKGPLEFLPLLVETTSTCGSSCSAEYTTGDKLNWAQSRRFGVSDRYGNIPRNQITNGNHRFSFSFTPFGYPRSSVLTYGSANVRCDNMDYLNASSAACVIIDNPPILDLTATPTPAPQLTAHVLNAQNSLLPGSVISGRPLHRLPPKDKQNGRNRAVACPSYRYGGYKRPANYSCDEYPFADTPEGAAKDPAYGRTFSFCQITGPPVGLIYPLGYSVCMLPDTQNSSGGGVMPSFYRKNRVLSGDAYYVNAY